MIKESFVEMPIGAQNAKYYERLGYDVKRRKTRDGPCVRRGTKITVKIEDVPKGSHVRITKICDRCGKEVPNIPVKDVYKCRTDGIDLCRACSMQEVMERRVQEQLITKGSLLECNAVVASEWDYDRNFPTGPGDVLERSHKRFYWLCSECHHSWKTSVDARASGTGCPMCRKSRGERRVFELLTSSGVKFEAQVSYPGLVGVQGFPLSFDFIVTTDAGKRTAIEYDGEHHFSPASFGRKDRTAEEMYAIVKEHDRRKDDWCKDNGIPLLRIEYLRFDDIPRIIDEHLRKLNGGACVGEV